MSPEEKELRIHSTMHAFTFYLDDITKAKVLRKLQSLGLQDLGKGTLSACIRVLLRVFAETDLLDSNIAEQIAEEYILTTKKNKRSTL